MNYALAYERLIAKARARVRVDGYSELHHVLPRSLGGTDDSSNLVSLTSKEHFVAHMLLAKMHGGTMWTALMIMKGNKNRYCNLRLFEIARKHAFTEREKAIREKRLADPAFDAYMNKVKSDATKNRREGYQYKSTATFKKRFSEDQEFADQVKKNRAKAQAASAETVRKRSSEKAKKILDLRSQGLSYTKIMKEVQCSIGFVSKVVNHAEIFEH